MLYIIHDNYFLNQFFLKQINDTQNISFIEVKYLKPSNKIIKILSALELFTPCSYFSKYYFEKSFVNNLKHQDIKDNILLWGSLSIIYSSYILKLANNNKKNVWLWNTLDHSFLSHIKLSFLKKRSYIYTFDPIDAKTYNINFKRQVYYRIKESNNVNDLYDFFFVGQDKGRVSSLISLKQLFEKNNLNYYFHILPEKDVNYSISETKLLKKDAINYAETINYIKHSRCLIEILQQGQSGVSLRALEALFFEKKLLTNNHNIINADFYNKNNIFIIGKDNFNSLNDFLLKPYEKISYDIVSNYEINNWIKTFTQ